MDSETIKHAIERSREYNETVKCEVSDSAQLEVDLAQYDCLVLEHIGWSEDDRGVLDACGLDWRLTITCNDLRYE